MDQGIIRRHDDFFDPVRNIWAGEFILAHYKKLTKGDLRKALWLYSGDSKYPDKVFKKMKEG